MSKYFGFSFAGAMMADQAIVKKEKSSSEEIRELAGELIPILNPSHQATVDAMKSRFGINVTIPDRAPRVTLAKGDTCFVMQVNLPRLEGRHEYTEQEIANANFAFSKYTVIE
jgi:hypothetical protein